MSDSFATFTPTETIDPNNPYQLPEKVGSNWSIKGWLFQLNEEQKRLAEDINNLQNAMGQIKDDPDGIKAKMQKQIDTMQDTLNNINEEINKLNQLRADNTANGDTSDIDPDAKSNNFGLPVERYELDVPKTTGIYQIIPEGINDKVNKNYLSVVKLNEKYALYNFNFSFVLSLGNNVTNPGNLAPFTILNNPTDKIPYQKPLNLDGTNQTPAQSLIGYICSTTSNVKSSVGKPALFTVVNSQNGLNIRLMYLDISGLKTSTDQLHIALNQNVLGVYNG